MYSHIMVPLDGSKFAEHALPYAVTLTRAAGAVLRLVLVHEPRSPRDPYIVHRAELIDAQQREQEQDYLTEVTRRVVSEYGIQPETSLLTGNPGATLTRFAAQRGIDLIVMSTHGRGGLSRMWLGSVADAVVRRAHVPTLLVRPGEDSTALPSGEIRRVLAAVDGSARAEAALEHALALCTTVDAACTIVRVVVPPQYVVTSSLADTAQLTHELTQARTEAAVAYLRDLITRSSDLPRGTRVETVAGAHAASAILSSAAEADADVIAVGTRGHGGVLRAVLGSVADKVIRGSDIPVLVCAPSPAETSAHASEAGAVAQQA